MSDQFGIWFDLLEDVMEWAIASHETNVHYGASFTHALRFRFPVGTEPGAALGVDLV